MPFAAPDGDAELGALARAFEAHVHEWLRTDPKLAVVSRERVHDALARTAPGVSGDALAKLMPSVVSAAGATRSLVGNLKRDGNGLELDLIWTNPDGDGAPRTIVVKGADAAAVFASYTKTLADAFRAEGVRVGAPPPMGPSALAAFGRGLVALDQHKPEQAATELSTIAQTPPPSALIALNLLEAEEQANQDLPAQNTRDAALKTFAQDQSPAARTLRARAESVSSDSPRGPTELAQAIKEFPHDPELVLQNAKALEAQGEGAQAIALLKEFVKTDDQDARAWFLLGHASISQGQVQQAVEDYLVRALVLNSRAGDLAAEAETRNAQGYGFERLGQLDYAIEQYTRAAAIREKIGDKHGLVQSLSNLAIAQAVKGDRDAANANLEKVKQLLEGMGDRASLADLYNNRGVVAEEQGDFKEALALYREALAIRQQLDEPPNWRRVSTTSASRRTRSADSTMRSRSGSRRWRCIDSWTTATAKSASRRISACSTSHADTSPPRANAWRALSPLRRAISSSKKPRSRIPIWANLHCWRVRSRTHRRTSRAPKKRSRGDPIVAVRSRRI